MGFGWAFAPGPASGPLDRPGSQDRESTILVGSAPLGDVREQIEHRRTIRPLLRGSRPQ